MGALVTELLAWVDANADYPSLRNVPPPIVRELSAEALNAGIGDESHDGAVPREAEFLVRQARYSREDGPYGTIFILEAVSTPGRRPDGAPLENSVFRARLLHGLVRHVQSHTGAYTACGSRSLAEVDALRLRTLYLRRHLADGTRRRRSRS